MAGRVVLYVVFAFLGVVAFLVTTSDASSRTNECNAASAILLSGLDDLRGRLDATPQRAEDDPVRGVAALNEVAAAYERLMGELQRLKIGANDVKTARADLARAIDQLHGWLVSYARAIEKGEVQNLRNYRASVDTARRDVDERVKMIVTVCAP